MKVLPEKRIEVMQPILSMSGPTEKKSGSRRHNLGTMEKELRQIRSTAYRRVQEVQGKADAEATQIYGQAYSKNTEFYAFLRTLESYKEKTNMNFVLILTTDSDFDQYIKNANPSQVRIPSAP